MAAAMRWYVLGRGGVGCLWASHLAKAGNAVTLLVRSGAADAQRIAIDLEDGWSRSAAGGRWQQEVELEEPGSRPDKIHRLLVATKAQDAGTGVASLAPRLVPNATIVLLQNGLGAADDILTHEALQGIQPLVVIGSTTHGSYLRRPYDIVHAGRGSTWLGIAQATIAAAAARGSHADVEATFQSVAASLSDTGLGPIIVETPAAMEGRLWGKLAINAALNPLTALLRCRNGEIVDTQHGRDAIRTCSQEVAQVMAARGLRTMQVRPCQCLCTEVISGTEYELNCPVDVHRALCRALSTGSQGAAEGSVSELAEQLEQFVVEAAETNAKNYSSMYQDAAAGRPTEVEYINGTVVKIAEEHEVPVPCNQLLLQQVRMLEALGSFGGPG